MLQQNDLIVKQIRALIGHMLGLNGCLVDDDPTEPDQENGDEGPSLGSLLEQSLDAIDMELLVQGYDAEQRIVQFGATAWRFAQRAEQLRAMDRDDDADAYEHKSREIADRYWQVEAFLNDPSLWSEASGSGTSV